MTARVQAMRCTEEVERPLVLYDASVSGRCLGTKLVLILTIWAA